VDGYEPTRDYFDMIEIKMSRQAIPEGYAHHYSTTKAMTNGKIIVIDLVQITNSPIPTKRMYAEAREQLEEHIGVRDVTIKPGDIITDQARTNGNASS